MGAPCTGKTTLLKALQSYYADQQKDGLEATKPAYISEVARKVLIDLGYSREDITGSVDKCLELQKAILQAQYEAEVTLENDQSVQWYISDRSGLDPIVFTQLYVGRPAADTLLASQAWQTLEKKMRKGLIVLCESGCSWLTDDGTRLMPQDLEEWARFDGTFRELFSARNLEYVLVPRDMVDIQARINLVLNAHHGRVPLVETARELEQSKGE